MTATARGLSYERRAERWLAALCARAGLDFAVQPELTDPVTGPCRPDFVFWDCDRAVVVEIKACERDCTRQLAKYKRALRWLPPKGRGRNYATIDGIQLTRRLTRPGSVRDPLTATDGQTVLYWAG